MPRATAIQVVATKTADDSRDNGQTRRQPRRRLIRFMLLAAIALTATAATTSLASQPDDEIVYVTKSGACYHRDGCNSLSKSKIPMKLSEAAARYRPCSRCRPPIPQANAGANSEGKAKDGEVRPTPKRAPAGDGQCQATTKKGTRCSRRAQAGSSYCWQHAR